MERSRTRKSPATFWSRNTGPGPRLCWAQALAVEGRLLGGEKLTDEPGRWVSGAPVADERVRSDVSGYFVIRAPSYDEAVDLAMASPHVRYGGVFEIRQIDAVN